MIKSLDGHAPAVIYVEISRTSLIVVDSERRKRRKRCRRAEFKRCATRHIAADDSSPFNIDAGAEVAEDDRIELVAWPRPTAFGRKPA